MTLLFAYMITRAFAKPHTKDSSTQTEFRDLYPDFFEDDDVMEISDLSDDEFLNDLFVESEWDLLTSLYEVFYWSLTSQDTQVYQKVTGRPMDFFFENLSI